MTTSEILFGTRLAPVSKKELSKLTGISVATLNRWQGNPDMIPLGKLRVLCRVRNVSEETVAKILKEGK